MVLSTLLVMAGNAVVRCWSRRDWKDLAVEWSRHPRMGPFGPWRACVSASPVLTVNLSPSICSELTRLAHDPTPVWRDAWPDALAWSGATFAHESAHVSGVANEASAECIGMQWIRWTAAMLGRTNAEGRHLAVLYWKHWYQSTPTRYRSRECRNGGRLDLHPRSDAWP